MADLKPPHTLRGPKRDTIAAVSKLRTVRAGLLYLWDSKRTLHKCPSNFKSTAIDPRHANAWVPNDDSGFKPVHGPRLGYRNLYQLTSKQSGNDGITLSNRKRVTQTHQARTRTYHGLVLTVET
jgi:hypothetical protein